MEAATLLLEAGACVNAVDDQGRTPLMKMPQRDGGDGLTQLLLAAGVDVVAADREGNTAGL